MTNNGRFLMLPKPILHELQQTRQNELIGYFTEYALDLDTGRKYSRAYYRQKWGVGGSKIERLIKMFNEALANMEASQYLENNYAQKQAGQKRVKNGVKTGQPNPDENESEAGRAGQKRGENGVKTGRIGNQDSFKKRYINISQKAQIEIPEDIDLEAYQAWASYRTSCGKSLNIHTAKLQFDELRAFEKKGFSNSEVIKYNIGKQYQGLYEPKRQNTPANNAPSFKDEILQRQFTSDKIKEVLKGQGIDWLDLVNKKAPMPKGINYETVKDQYRNTLYIFYPTQEPNGELIECA